MYTLKRRGLSLDEVLCGSILVQWVFEDRIDVVLLRDIGDMVRIDDGPRELAPADLSTPTMVQRFLNP